MSTEKNEAKITDYKPTITTHFTGPDETRRNRISAQDDEGRQVVITLPNEYDVDHPDIADMHFRVLQHFCKVFGLEGVVTGGWLGCGTTRI